MFKNALIPPIQGIQDGGVMLRILFDEQSIRETCNKSLLLIPFPERVSVSILFFLVKKSEKENVLEEEKKLFFFPSPPCRPCPITSS